MRDHVAPPVALKDEPLRMRLFVSRQAALQARKQSGWRIEPHAPDVDQPSRRNGHDERKAAESQRHGARGHEMAVAVAGCTVSRCTTADAARRSARHWA